jgi:asparagine synthase (glutamine-hydrolysing)
MCAINGFNFKDEELIAKMNVAIRHRGPDGTGVFCSDGISLGHDRLSIIDLSAAGAQPMYSGDGRYVIVFNGEIYNYRELKNELGDYPFKSASDTEVILAAYEKWGEECVKKFNGIFAFVIWDEQKRELFLARDPIGVKPLYYFWDGKKLIFSSEIKAILEHDVPRILDREAFNHYLRLLYVPEPMTMFADIKKFPAGSMALLRGAKFTIKRYWEDARGEKFTGGLFAAAEKLRSVVDSAVERQLVSDRPLGIYLSGGIDSSVILDAVSRRRGEIDTFSVGFDLPERGDMEKFNQDFYLARRTAKHYGTNHNEVMISPDDALELLEKSAWHLDEPIANPTTLAMLHLAGFAKQKADVVLGGDGGDELFGGYERYRLSLLASYYQKILPAALRRVLVGNERLRKLNVPAGAERYALFMFQKDDILRRAVCKDFLRFDTEEFFRAHYFSASDIRPFEEQFMEADLRSWLRDESLMMTDKMSMASGIEERVPLLDLEVVALADSLPLHYKISPFNTKIILKEAFRGRIPDFLLKQPKRGWFSPGAKWLRHPAFYERAREVLSSDYYVGTKDIFHWDELREILVRHHDKREYNVNIIWAVMVFQIWARQFKVKLS